MGQNSRKNLTFLFAGMTLLGCIFMISGITLIWDAFATPLRPATQIPFVSSPTAITVSLPTKIAQTPTPVPANTATATPTELPYVMEVNSKDQAEMVLVPSGEFTMGSDSQSDPYFWGAEGPEHLVFLDEYYIYRTEVTTDMYQDCVEAQACPKPAQSISASHEEYFGNSEYADYPVIYVSWVGAVSYCKWVGGDLPTEAQWEKAARGTDARLFPWGDDPSADSTANWNFTDTLLVGTFPEGISPYGALDMAGNVLEWVLDRFQSGFYSVSPFENPVGPAGGNRRVIRGGAWHHSDISALRTVARASMNENYTGNDIGFRCAMPLP